MTKDRSAYEPLAASNRDWASLLDPLEARRRIEEHRLLTHPAASAEQVRIRALVAAPLHAEQRAECQTLLEEALRKQGYPMRPGSVEDVWMLEGLFDRLMDRRSD
jgi:hypothetical protein